MSANEWNEGPARSRDRAACWILAAGALAGLAAFGLGEATYRLVPPEERDVPIVMGRMIHAPTGETKARADAINATIAYGLLGLCLAGGLGVAGGLTRRSARGAIAAGSIGALVAAVLAAGAAFVALPRCMAMMALHPDREDVLAILMHGLPWGVAGAVAGVAAAFGLGRPRRAFASAIAGGLGAVLGAGAFGIVGALLFPMDEIAAPISATWASRLTARVVVALIASALVALTVSGPLPAPAPAPLTAPASEEPLAEASS